MGRPKNAVAASLKLMKAGAFAGTEFVSEDLCLRGVAVTVHITESQGSASRYASEPIPRRSTWYWLANVDSRPPVAATKVVAG